MRNFFEFFKKDDKDDFDYEHNLKSAKGKQLKMPYSDLAFSLEYAGISVDDNDYWYWCVSPIYGEDNKVHLFCSRWPIGNGMNGWFTKSEIAHFVGNSPTGPFHYEETVLCNDNLPDKSWQMSPHNPQIYKFDNEYVLIYIVQDTREKRCSMKISLMHSKSLNGPWTFAGDNGIVVKPSEDKSHWTYNSCTGTENPAMTKIEDTYYIFFKAGKSQDSQMHYGYACSKSIDGPYVMSDASKMDNINYVEDATCFQQNGKVYLLTTDNFGSNTGIFGAGILWEFKNGAFKTRDAQIGFGVLSDYLDLPKKTTFYQKDRSGKLERPGILMKDGKPSYFYGCTRASVTGSKKSCCYVMKIKG